MLTSFSENHAPSYYAASANGQPDYAILDGDISCDVCVIGGGYTGLSSALHLAEREYNVVLIEANRVGWGASGRNGGQVSGAPMLLMDDLVALYGKAAAHDIWELSNGAKDLVFDLVEKHRIACDPVLGHMACASYKSDMIDFKAHIDYVEREFDYPHYQLMQKDQSIAVTGCKAYHGAMFDASGGHLHPLNYALGLAEAAAKAGARIFEFSPARKIDYGDPAVITTHKAKITADYVILGCNGYLGGLEPRVACNMIAVDDYQIATQPLSDEQLETVLPNKACVYNTKHLLHYYRLSADNRLIFGGGHGRPGQEPGNMKSIVRKHMLDVYPQLDNLRIDYTWAGTDTFTMSEMPDFGRLAGNAFYAHGYTGHGVALSTLAGQLMAEAIAGTVERFDVFDRIPHRKIPGSTLFRSPMIMIGIRMFAVLDWLRK